MVSYSLVCAQQPAACVHTPSALPQVVWSTGATSRSGSLGAPLFDNRTQQVVGVLVGSTSSCTTPGRPDYFGRLSAVRPSFPHQGGAQ